MRKVKMMMTLAVMAMVAAVFESCKCSSTSDSGNREYSKEELTAKPFTKIEVEAVANVYYTQNNGEETNVRVDYASVRNEEVKAEYKRTLQFVYKDNKLIITQTGGNFKNKNEVIDIYVTSPDLVAISNDGVGKFESNSINSDNFSISHDGVGKTIIKNLLANKIDIDNDGVGSINVEKLKGDVVSISLDGVGSTQVGNLKCQTLTISSDGVGSVKAHVDCEKVDVSLDGVGSVKLSGVTRHLNKQKDGVGSINTGNLKVMSK